MCLKPSDPAKESKKLFPPINRAINLASVATIEQNFVDISALLNNGAYLKLASFNSEEDCENAFENLWDWIINPPADYTQANNYYI